MLNLSIAQTTNLRFSIGVEDLTKLSDEALLELSLKSPSAFEVLLSRYQSQFLLRAQAVVKGRDQAEDVVQETFVRIYRFAPRFSADAGNFRSWSLTILMNVARTHYQRQARERGNSVALEPEHYESLADTKDEGKEGDAAYAKEVLEQALGRTPKDVADILRLAFIDGLPHAEIAKQLGISPEAVKTRVHRAKAVVRDIIKKHNLV